MRAIGLAAAVLVLVGCGSESRTEVRYDVSAATDCIRHAQPSNTSRSLAQEDFGGLSFVFGDDHFSYLYFMVVVGYGADRAEARSSEPQPAAGLRPKRVWGRHDGNVVYDAFGPSEVVSLKHRPPGLTVRQIRRWTEISSRRMRAELDQCMAKARRGVRRSPPPRKSPPAPTAS